MILTGHDAARGKLQGCSVAIGSFDGVHRGHQTLLHAAAAVPHRGPLVALTFDPHPARLLKPQFAPKLIMPLRRRLAYLHQAGADVVLVEPFTADLAKLDAEDFVQDILLDALQPDAVTVGHDFTYGAKRSGDAEALTRQLNQVGVELRVLAPIRVDGIVASSTRVRAFVLDGQVEGARLVLGRHFSICGQVVHGAGRGGGLGFKTLNIMTNNELFPRRGVYATWVQLPGFAQPLRSVSNVGRNPTFGDEDLHIETHVFAELGDQYQQDVELLFVRHLRDERRFADAAALVKQIALDVEQTQKILDQDQVFDFSPAKPVPCG